MSSLHAGATLREAFEYPFTRLDPVRGDHVDPPSAAIFETLLRKGSHGQPQPGLAQSWQVDANGRIWRLRLRDGARFHSGPACDAQAVVAALEACRWGDGLPRQVWYWDPVDTVRALDDATIEIHLHDPCLRLPVLLWGTHTAIANPEAWHRLGDDFGVTCADGTGPYRLTSFAPEQVVADRVDPTPGPRRIIWNSVPDDDVRDACLNEAAYDIVRYVRSGAHPADTEGSSPLPTGWRFDRQHENSQFLLALNFDDPRGFGDVDVRRAIDAYLDRQRVLDVALAGQGDARRSPIPCADPDAAVYDPEEVRAASPEQAGRVLAELGWRPDAAGVLARGQERMSIDCVIQDTAVARAIATEVARQVRSGGIELRLRPVPVFEAFYRAVAAGPAAFISKWLWPDAMEAIMGFSRADCIEPGGGNWQHARCPEVDAAYDTYLRAPNQHALGRASAEAQRAFMTHLPYLPLVSPMESMAVRSRVRGFGLTPVTLYPNYQDVDLSQGTA